MSSTKFHEKIHEKKGLMDFSHLVIVIKRTQKRLGWDDETASKVLTEYVRFMSLIAKHPKAIFSPSQLVDEVWHDHVLHTRMYMEDCENLCGHYIHHQPGTPEGCFDDFASLYQQEFKEVPPEMIWANCGGGKGCRNCNYK